LQVCFLTKEKTNKKNEKEKKIRIYPKMDLILCLFEVQKKAQFSE